MATDVNPIIAGSDPALGVSRHELKIKHRQLITIEKELQKKYKQMRVDLNTFAEDYNNAHDYLPWSRYTIWQTLVERLVSEANIRNLQQLKEQSNVGQLGSAGPGILLPRIRSEFEDIDSIPLDSLIKNFYHGVLYPRNGRKNKITDLMVTLDAAKALQENAAKTKGAGLEAGLGAGSGEKRPLITGKKPHGKGKQLFRKIKKMSGLCDDPVEDEDVMSSDRLLSVMRSKQRRIKTLHDQFCTVYASLDKLRRDFECVRVQWCCCGGYCTLGNIIENFIAETEADTHYE